MIPIMMMNGMKVMFKFITKLFKKDPPKEQPIVHVHDIPYETLVFRARAAESMYSKYGITDRDYVRNQIINELTTELMQQLLNQEMIEFRKVSDFGQTFIEAQLLVSRKK